MTNIGNVHTLLRQTHARMRAHFPYGSDGKESTCIFESLMLKPSVLISQNVVIFGAWAFREVFQVK